FGYDFSRVRVHADSAAERSARDLSASAYTAGNDIVFSAGAYAPSTAAGRALLPPELVHVVQQQARAASLGPVPKKGGTFGGFFANLGRAIVSIFTSEPSYDDDTLKAYLKVLGDTKDIEDDFDSDNKARAVVRRWMSGASGFELTAGQMILLIREMDTGDVS